MSIIKKRVVAGLQAVGFVLLTLAAWRVFASIASDIVSCVPWGGQTNCNSPFAGHPFVDTAVRVGVLVVALLAATWVGSRWFYTPDTYDPDPKAKAAAEQPGSADARRPDNDLSKEMSRPQAVGE
jgi:hypothetical protein